MFSFFKRHKNTGEVPVWADFFDKREYGAFEKEVDGYFEKLNIKHRIVDGIVNVESNDFGSGKLGLNNLAQVCKQNGIKRYKQLIADHFNAMLRAHKFGDEVEKIVPSFEEVEKYIGVRLYNQEYILPIGKKQTVGFDFAGDIYAMLIFDFPDSVQNVQPEQTIAWHKTIQELFETGKRNIKDKYEFALTKINSGGFDVWFLRTDHFFAGNIVFDLENRQELIGNNGSLVALPHRHSAIIYPIESIEVVKALNALIPAVYGMNREGPGSLSDKLFWYKDGVFTPLPYSIEHGVVKFFPPESFIETLNRLSENNN